MENTAFVNFLREKRAWYKTIKKVYCPILGKEVVFNSKGFRHLRRDSFHKARNVKEQTYKLGLLPLVIPVLKTARKIKEYKQQQYSKPLGKYFEVWELEAVVGKQNTRVSVVLRKIGDGNITFLSVWKAKDK